MDMRIWFGVAASLAGCAAPVYEGKYAYADGWRLAKVTQVGNGYALIANSTRDCREELPPEKVARRKFARVTFTSARNFHADIVPVAPGSPVEEDGQAYVNMDRCEEDAHAR
jgi:hypothetical protein